MPLFKTIYQHDTTKYEHIVPLFHCHKFSKSCQSCDIFTPVKGWSVNKATIDVCSIFQIFFETHVSNHLILSVVTVSTILMADQSSY